MGCNSNIYNSFNISDLLNNSLFQKRTTESTFIPLFVTFYNNIYPLNSKIFDLKYIKCGTY